MSTLEIIYWLVHLYNQHFQFKSAGRLFKWVLTHFGVTLQATYLGLEDLLMEKYCVGFRI